MNAMTKNKVEGFAIHWNKHDIVYLSLGLFMLWVVFR